MWYRGSITVPIGRAAATPITAEVEICRGTIESFYRLFPPGCAGKVHLQIFHQTRQLFPTTPGQSYIGDGSEVLGDASVTIDEPPFVVELRAWSPGTTYHHVVYVEFYIKSEVFLLLPVAERDFVPVPVF